MDLRRWLLAAAAVAILPGVALAQSVPVNDARANEALNAAVLAPPPGPTFAPFAEPGRPDACSLSDQAPGTWAAITEPEFLTLNPGNYENYDAGQNGDIPWNVTVDPFTPCRWYRIGYDTDGRTNPRRLRSVIERSTEASKDGTRKWEAVFDGAAHGLPTFAAREVVVPSRRRVFVTEDGNGVGVLRGDLAPDGRITWSAANGRTTTQQGISGQKVIQLVFAPGSDEVAYAVTRPCDAQSTSPYCVRQTPGHPLTDTYQLWSTADGGGHWANIGAWQPFGYWAVKVAVDPFTPGSLLVAYTLSSATTLLGAVPPRSGIASCIGPPGGGAPWSCIGKYEGGFGSFDPIVGLYATRSPATGGLRLWVENTPSIGIPNWVYSDDGGATWPLMPRIAGVAPIIRQRPTPGGELLTVGVMLSGGASYTESATYVWRGPGEKEIELLPEPEGVLPMFYPETVSGRRPVTRAAIPLPDGGFIVPHVMHCAETYKCPGLEPPDRQQDGAPLPFRIQLLRYAPDPGRVPDRRAMPFSEGPPSSGTSLAGLGSCPDDPPGAHFSTVVYTGEELLVSRGDPGPAGKPYTAVLHRYRPRAEGANLVCDAVGTVEIDFPPTVYDAVRDATPYRNPYKPWGVERAHVLPATQPRIGEMSFDPATGRLWLVLRATGAEGDGQGTWGNRTGLWTADLPARELGVPVLRTKAKHLHNDLVYCTQGSQYPQGGTSTELLTLDPLRRAVWGCPVGRAAPISMATGERMEHPCRFDAPFRGVGHDGAGSNWLIDDLRFVDGDRVLMTNRLYVYLVDVATCGRKTKTYAWPSGLSSSGTVTQSYVSMTCDALTFAERYDSNDGRQLAPGTTALWVPTAPVGTGIQFPKTPWALAWPDPDVLCPWDTALSVPQAEVTEGEDAVVAARLVQVSNGAPAWGQRVAMTLAGRSLGMAVTDRSGVAKVVVPAKDVPRLPEAGVAATFEITATFAGTAAYRPAGPAKGSLLVRPLRPAIQPPPEVLVIPPTPAPAPVPALLPPLAPALLPQPAQPPPSSNAPQSQAQPTQASAQEEQKQFEGQLAIQESERNDETAEEEEYAMSAVSRGPHDGSATATMATALGMLIGFGVWVRAQVSPSRQRARARRRR